MATTLSLILDDSSTDFTYGGPGKWTVNQHALWYGGTTTFAGFANARTFGSFQVTFEGTSIAFTGNTPIAAFSQSITVRIDGGTPYNSSYMDPSPQTYLQWYQSPMLAEGSHTITVDGVDGTAIDYATITVGQNTPLEGKMVIVDDDDPSIHYLGSWSRNTDRFNPGGTYNIPGVAFRNSTHRSTTPGDTITFLFTGTSVAVYGMFSWGNIGTLGATYTLDGGAPTTKSYAVTPSSASQHLDVAQDEWNFPFILLDSLPTGDHALVINITQCLNHPFVLDYITYTPSFANLASMPSVVFTTPTSSPTSTSALSSRVASATVSQGPQQSVGSNQAPVGSNQTAVGSNQTAVGSIQTPVGSNQTPAGTKQTPVGLIVGGVVGGLLVVAFMTFLFFWLRRRKLKENLVLLKPFDELRLDNLNSSSSIQLEGKTPQNPTQTLSGSGVFPFQDTGSRAAAHLASIADLKQERNMGSSLPHVLSTTESTGAIGQLNPTNSTTQAIAFPYPSSGVRLVDPFSEPGAPPAYDVISVHLTPHQ